MKFVVSSSDLLAHLQAINKVISSKNTLPILDNFLFQLQGNELTVTASDLESTMITRMDLENAMGEGSIAIEAKRLTDILKEFSEQPLTFEIDMESLAIDVYSENGKFSVVGQMGEDFPQIPEIKESSSTSINLAPNVLLSGINKTLFATADDELRPVMNGILLEFTTDNLIFVSSDAHKLVRYRRMDAQAEKPAKFILPKKPASLLKNILPKEESEVVVKFDDKNALFSLENYKLICRLTEGNYPSYESVIPVGNPNRLIIDRVEFYNSIKRVSVFSNQASNLIRMELTNNLLKVSAQDIDFSISAFERLNCQYEGEDLEIGFKSVFLIEILSNLSSTDVVFELADPAKAGLLLPYGSENESEDTLMLVMPMMINV